MDYLDFYGLEQEPFSSAPISKFYFNSAQHQRALVRLMYAVDSMKGLAVLIGELGTGKTTLARRMLDNLPEEEYESALLVIIHSGITADWLLARIARQLGVEDPPPEKLKLLNQLFNRLAELHEEGKKAVVLIDEAQMLQSREIMEEFRGLLNLELGESNLITFVFFGLPELEDHLHLDEPLAQRVALKCSLDSFNLDSTEGYINHRLRLAGGQGALFTDDAIKLINHFSRGIPRLINTICDNSLFEGYLLKKKNMEADLVQSVAADLGLVPIPKAKPRAQQAPARVIQVSAQHQQVPAQQIEAPPVQAYDVPGEMPPLPEESVPAPPDPPETEQFTEMEIEMAPPAGPGQPIETEVAEDEMSIPDLPDLEMIDGSKAVPDMPPLPDEPPPAIENIVEEDEDEVVMEEEEDEVVVEEQEEGPSEDIDAMFNGITEDEDKPKGEEENIDSMLDGWEDK